MKNEEERKAVDAYLISQRGLCPQPKFEIRISKSETNSNNRISKIQNKSVLVI